MTQKEIFEILKANPLKVKVWIGELDDMNGEDYIFLDYLTDNLTGSDDGGVYETVIQITVATKDFERNKTLVSYIKQHFNVTVNYERSAEFQYYLARCRTGLWIC